MSATPNKPEPDRKSDYHLLLAPLFFFIVVGALAAVAIWFFAGVSTPEVTVPNVVGKKYEDATEELRKFGFAIEIIPEIGADTLVGQVVRTSPAAGSRVKPGRSIILYVVAGEALVFVPDLVGTYFIEAENRLRRAGINEGYAGLVLGTSTSVVSDSPPGTILWQSPASGSRAKVGDKVDIHVAVSKELEKMPNLVGLTLTDALEKLASMGYSASIENYFTTSQPPNTVLNQKPSPGTTLSPETVIRLDVATPATTSKDTMTVAPPEESDAESSDEPTLFTPPMKSP